MVIVECGKSTYCEDFSELVIEFDDIKKALKTLRKLCLENKYDYYMIREERKQK